MKTSIKARITWLFISKTTIMVNKREIIILHNFYFRRTAIVFLYFFNFIPFLLLIFFFLPIFFVLILSYLSGTCTLFWRHIWAEITLLFWTFLSGTFFQVGGGGGCTCTQCTPCVRAWAHIYQCSYTYQMTNVIFTSHVNAGSSNSPEYPKDGSLDVVIEVILPLEIRCSC